MEACPHCGFVNKPTAVRCECCLSEIRPAGAAEADAAAAAPVSSHGGVAAEAAPVPPAAPPAHSTDAEQSAAPASLAPEHQEPEPARLGIPEPDAVLPQPPPIQADIARKSNLIIVGLILVAVLGIVWIMRPKAGGSSFLSQLFGSRAAQPAKTSPRPSAPVSSAPAAPPATAPHPEAGAPAASAAAPAASGRSTPPAAAPAAPAAPAMSREDQAADAQYQIVLNLLSRKQTTPARHALEQLLQKYPKSKVAPEARDLLAQLPPAEDALPATPAVRTAPASRPARASSPAPAQPQGTPTAEDNAAPEAPRKVVIPSSLMGQKAAPAGAATSPDDNVRVVSSNYNEGALVLNLEYTLASQHTKRVFLGAWMLGESVSRRLGYTATPMAQGRGSSNVTLSDIPPSASSLRVVFFEEGGALFFQKDFTISK